MKKLPLLLTLIMALPLLFGVAAYAFTDVPEGPDRDKVLALQERGIVGGYGDAFRSERPLSYAEGVHLIVKAFGLNIDNLRFIKAPEASDSYDKVPNDAWYAPDFVIAAYTGLELPRDVNPNAAMTREVFAHYLLKGLRHTGEFGFTKMRVPVADEADVSSEYQGDLQQLLNGRIVELDGDRRFHPTRAITRLEAAVMVYNALAFADRLGEKVDPNDLPTLSTERVSDEVNRVTLTWSDRPHAGYGVSITKVVFRDDGKAEVHYKLHTPEPGKMYAQVITTSKAVTYVAAGYEPVAVQER